MSPLSRCFMATVVAGVGLAATAAQAQTVILNETFGSSADRVASPYVPRSQVADPGYYGARLTGPVVDGSYTIMRPQNINASTASTYWPDPPGSVDHTGDPGGALMVLNAGSGLDLFYRRTFAVQPGFSYRISVWRYTVNPDLTQNPPGPIEWSLQVHDVGTNITRVESGPIPNTARHVWEESVFTFTVPATCAAAASGGQAELALRNQSPITGGNDIYIDDITVTRLPVVPGTPETCPTVTSSISAGDDGPYPATPGTPMDINVRLNDGPGNLDTPTLLSQPAVGTASVKPDGTINYAPPATYTGPPTTLTFDYQVCTIPTPQTSQSCDTATVTVNLAPTNAVIPDDESASTPLNKPVVINVKDGDTTTTGTLGNPTVPTQPAHGTASVNPDGTITYTPTPGFTGVDTFEYEICNDTSPPACATARVTVNVTAVHADDDNANTLLNTPVAIDVNDGDMTTTGTLGNPTVTTSPGHGTTAVNTNGTITYTPNTGFTGVDTFEYQICNDATPPECDTARVTVRVGAVAPTAVPALGGTEMALLGGLLAAVGVGVRRRQQRAAKR